MCPHVIVRCPHIRGLLRARASSTAVQLYIVELELVPLLYIVELEQWIQYSGTEGVTYGHTVSSEIRTLLK